MEALSEKAGRALRKRARQCHNEMQSSTLMTVWRECRKFTTEIFDTGVALAAYAGMLLWYDWRLALLCMLFPPISYMTAEKMKKMIQRTGAAYKEQSGALSAATLDRAENAITYRVFGREKERQNAYEENLSAYEKSAVRANIWNTAMPPVYRVISMAGVLFILYFGQKNVLGNRLACMGHCGVYHIFCRAL